MKQKYIMPKAELIEVKANAILAGSNVITSDDRLNFNEPTMATVTAVQPAQCVSTCGKTSTRPTDINNRPSGAREE